MADKEFEMDYRGHEIRARKLLMEKGFCTAEKTFSGFRPCVTGKSGSGHCGAAAFCAESYKCCAECPERESCNIQCGWINGRKPKREEESYVSGNEG